MPMRLAMVRRTQAAVVFFVALTLAANGAAQARPSSRAPHRDFVSRAVDCSSCVADFAIYDALYEDDGVWEEEVTALTSLLTAYGWTYEKVTPAQINGGVLGQDDLRKYRALIAPGGWAAVRMGDVTATGDDNIKAFVSSGGNYVGFCAGSYWASKTVSFAGTATGDGGKYNKGSDYHSFTYDLKLFKGTAKGPFGWIPWSSTEANFDRVQINLDNSTMAAASLPGKTHFFYAGGPFFTYSEKPEGFKVWARAMAPSGTSDAADTGDGKPTVVRFGYGTGLVILFSYHPEILVGSMADGVELNDYYDESAIRWDTGNQTQSEVNVDSWNIVHAAFQVATGQTVTPVVATP